MATNTVSKKINKAKAKATAKPKPKTASTSSTKATDTPRKATGTPADVTASIKFRSKAKPRYAPGDFVEFTSADPDTRTWYVYEIYADRDKNGWHYVYRLHTQTEKLNAFGYLGSEHRDVRGSLITKSKRHPSVYSQETK